MMLLLIILSIVIGRKIAVSKLACDVKITEVPYSKELVPAKINPTNFLDLQMALQCCKIDRAQVAGWNDHDGDYVLYKNGTVVPAVMNDLPNVGLFFKRCKCNNMKVVCVYDPNGENPKCFLPCAYPTSISKCHVDEPCKKESIISKCEFKDTKPLPVPYKCIPECFKESKPTCSTECPQSECEIFTSCIKKVDCDENSKKEQRIKTSKVYSYKCVKTCDKKPETILTIKECCSKKTEEEINMSRRHKPLCPKILNKPKLIYNIKKSIEETVKKPVCIYASISNKLYVSIDYELFRICLSPPDYCIILKDLDHKKAKKLTMRGLFLLLFDE